MPKLEVIAQALMKKETLDTKEFAQLMAQFGEPDEVQEQEITSNQASETN